MRVLLFVCALALCLSSKEYNPDFVVQTNGGIASLRLFKDMLYISQNNALLRVYDLRQKKFIQSFALNKITDFFGTGKMPKIYNSDTFDGKHILVLSEAGSGSRELRIFSPLGVRVVFDESDNLWIVKALWVDTDLVILGLMGNEIALYDLKSKAFVYKVHLSTASFSDIVLSEDKAIAYSTDESGAVYKILVSNGKILNKFEGINKDNNYELVSAKNIVLTAGQDRKMGIYGLGKEAVGVGVQAKFLVYAVGISNDAKYGAMMYDEEGSIAIINLATQKIQMFLKGAHCILNTIVFYHQQVIASCDGKKIFFWNLKGKQ